MTFDEAISANFYHETGRCTEASVSMSTPSDHRLIVALDMPTAAEARTLVDKLGSSVSFYKIGLELLFGDGLELAKELKAKKNEVFLDMKLLDIGNTVQKAVANIARLNFDYLTVHGLDRKTLKAAVEGRKNNKLKLLSVTVLTSLDEQDLLEQGIITEQAHELAVRRAVMACEMGFDGVIASGHEAKSIREATSRLKENFIIKVPGIRLAGSAQGDQTRVMTPADAIGAGADYLVVGRPITEAADPLRTAEAFKAEIKAAASDQAI